MINNLITIFREEATAALAGFHAGPVQNGIWRCQFLWREETRRKNPQSKARTNNKLNPHMAPGRNRFQATLVGGECSH